MQIPHDLHHLSSAEMFDFKSMKQIGKVKYTALSYLIFDLRLTH